jgi:hypothetical protein
MVASAEERKFSTRMDMRGHLLSVLVSSLQKRPWAAIMLRGVGGGEGGERQDTSAYGRARSDKEENDEICHRRPDDPAQEVIKVEVSGLEVEVMTGMRYAGHARSSSVPRPGCCDRVAFVA